VNSIDVSAYRVFGPEDRADARRRLELPDVPLVVCVGRLSRQKGQDLLLDAWPIVRRAVANAALVLVGDGPDREVLVRREEPGVQLVGSRADVAEWLCAADVVAVPSRYDCPSLAMLEAMACGRTVVAHDVGGLTEICAPEGRAIGGTLVPLGDRHALADAIVSRLSDPELAAAEGRAGRELVEQNHDIVSWGERLCEIASRVAAG
jgi:glycosyltransferase involved in cell wall biosynthesis